MKKKPKEVKAPPEMKIDRSFLCSQHVFFDFRTDNSPKEGDGVWMYCQFCLLTLKKVLRDEADKF